MASPLAALLAALPSPDCPPPLSWKWTWLYFCALAWAARPPKLIDLGPTHLALTRLLCGSPFLIVVIVQAQDFIASGCDWVRTPSSPACLGMCSHSLTARSCQSLPLECFAFKRPCLSPRFHSLLWTITAPPKLVCWPPFSYHTCPSPKWPPQPGTQSTGLIICPPHCPSLSNKVPV